MKNERQICIKHNNTLLWNIYIYMACSSWYYSLMGIKLIFVREKSIFWKCIYPDDIS